jgi:hypothetical protein
MSETVIPRSEKEERKPLYVCPGCSNHTYNNNLINRYNISLNLQAKILQNSMWVQNKDYRVAQNSKRRCGFHRHNRKRDMPSFLLLHLAGTLDFDCNIWFDLKQL